MKNKTAMDLLDIALDYIREAVGPSRQSETLEYLEKQRAALSVAFEVRMLVCRVDGSLERPDLEYIEGSEWTARELEEWLAGKDGVLVYTLSEFMDEWNNEDLTDAEHWLGYIYLKEVVQ